MVDISPEQSMQAAFEYVARVYEETAFLFKDLQREMEGHGFESQLKTQYGSNLSRSIDQPRMWLPRFVSEYWIDTKGGLDSNGRPVAYLGASAIFFSPNGEAIIPLLCYGLFNTMNHQQASYQYQWVWMVCWNEGGCIEYPQKELSFDPPRSWPEGEPIRFECQLKDESYDWPKQGFVITRLLTSITDANGVSQIASEMKSLWSNHFGASSCP